MRVFPVGVEHPLDVAIKRSHDTNTRMHQWPAILRRHDQCLDGGLPLRALMFGLRQSGDEIGGILQRDELATARQRDRIVERSFPVATSHLRPVATRPDIGGAFGLASPQTELSAPFNCAPRKDQNTGSDEARNEVAEPPTERDAKESQ